MSVKNLCLYCEVLKKISRKTKMTVIDVISNLCNQNSIFIVDVVIRSLLYANLVIRNGLKKGY